MSEYLEVNGVALNDTDAYWIEDLSPLRSTADRAGSIIRAPYVPGGVAFTHRDTFTDYVFELFITGPTWAELDANEAVIVGSVVGPPEVDTVPASWHRNNGEVWATDVIVRGIYEPALVADRPPTMRYNLVLAVIDGRFSPPESS